MTHASRFGIAFAFLVSTACMGSSTPDSPEAPRPQPTAAATCADGDAEACFQDARSLDKAGDHTAAVPLYERSCDLGGVGACINLALLLQDGLGAEPDPARAVILLTEACDKGDMVGCANLGRTYFEGDGVPQDLVRGIELLRAGCEHNDASACSNLGVAAYSGQGLSQSVEAAQEYWRKACDLDHGQACFNLSRLALAGPDADAGHSEVLREKACSLGYQKACESTP